MKFKTCAKPLSYYISRDNPLYEDLLTLIRTEYRSGMHLYEARSNTEYVVNDLTGNLIKTGRVNLVGYELRGNDDIVELAKIIGNKKFETCRIIYVRDGTIVGQDAVTIDMPNMSLTHAEKNNPIAFSKMKLKMDRVGADGYYIVHNHPSGDSTPSNADKRTCQIFNSGLTGFISGIVIGKDNYSVITIDSATSTVHTKQGGSFADSRPQLTTPADVVDYVSQLTSGDDASYVVYADSKLRLIAVQRIENKEFNDKNIFAYLNNEKRINGASGCFLYTTDDTIYNKACAYTGGDGLFTDTFYPTGRSTYKSAVSDHDNLGMVVKNDKLKPTKL